MRIGTEVSGSARMAACAYLGSGRQRILCCDSFHAGGCARAEGMGDVRHCGAGEELTLLYDGGYQRYVQAGVISASQRFFRLANGTVETTCTR